MMDLSIVILHHGSPKDVSSTLEALASARLPQRTEVLVVNNGTPGCNEAIALPAHFGPELRFFEIPNKGYPQGVNFGLNLARGRFLCVCGDVEVERNTFSVLLNYLEAHPRVGMVAPRLVFPNGKIQDNFRVFPRVGDLIVKRTFFRKFFKKSMARYLMWHKEPQESEPVDWLTGAFQLMTRKCWEAAGPQDERYFLFMSDVDLCRQVWEKGFEVHFVGATQAIHPEARLSAGGILSLKKWVVRQHIIDALKYFWKYLHHPLPKRRNYP